MFSAVGISVLLGRGGRQARRDREIQGWLDAANYSGGWLALDDSVEFFNGGHPNLYLTNGDVGLTEKDVAAIGKKIQFLSAPVLDTSLDDGYKAMAADKAREAEAQDWCNALAKDMADEAR